ncbi:hypothetical protein JFN94_06750 [Burkholderia anthina]|uniref:Uncharacterized protein n=1 Tax=Burkholderia anthina TaxID=179879 RepID=A0A7T7AIG3_9BURK|nr:hypothetical protein [Burkholderia anthina]QQK03856.1 hypothetical protein JFN94_06750 [Burkholderia anthina]
MSTLDEVKREIENKLKESNKQVRNANAIDAFLSASVSAASGNVPGVVKALLQALRGDKAADAARAAEVQEAILNEVCKISDLLELTPTVKHIQLPDVVVNAVNSTDVTGVEINDHGAVSLSGKVSVTASGSSNVKGIVLNDTTLKIQ